MTIHILSLPLVGSPSGQDSEMTRAKKSNGKKDSGQAGMTEIRGAKVDSRLHGNDEEEERE
jgi:hypothetical protein